jgi:glycosyltransferase involved in cell wall biosynthesis
MTLPRRPTIAAIIPCHDVEPWVADCIRSVLDQESPFDEVILIDDASSDGTFNVLRGFAGERCVRIERHERNRGLGPTRNRGARLTECDYICFVDADDVIERRFVSSFLDAVRREPALDMYCFSAINFRDEDGVVTEGFLHSAHWNGPGGDAFARVVTKGEFSSCAVLYVLRRTLIDWEGNGFLNIIHEDEEFTPRLFLAARHVVLDPAVLYRRRIRGGSITARAITTASMRGCAAALRTVLRLCVEHRSDPPVRAALGRRVRYLSRIVAGQGRRLLLASVLGAASTPRGRR